MKYARTHARRRGVAERMRLVFISFPPKKNTGGGKKGRNPPKTTQRFDICSPASVNRLGGGGDGRGEGRASERVRGLRAHLRTARARKLVIMRWGILFLAAGFFLGRKVLCLCVRLFTSSC